MRTRIHGQSHEQYLIEYGLIKLENFCNFSYIYIIRKRLEKQNR